MTGLTCPPALVARLCDRRTGIGADGVLRAVRTAALPEGVRPGDDRAGGGAEWFMDYRNADGSVAEMCGNGVRVFARYLLDHGLAEGPAFAVATRAGVRQVRAEPDGQLTVDMGPARARPRPGRGGRPVTARACGLASATRTWPAWSTSRAGRLRPVRAARGRPGRVPRRGQRRAGPGHRRPARAQMRVHERGSGETLSCGTGAVAAAVAAATRRSGGGRWTVQVPGGRLAVTLGAATSLLTGPAVIVAEGELDEAWLATSS